MLKSAILLRYRCEAMHCQSVHVHELQDGQTIWEGYVEVFDLMDFPEAHTCYAWSHADVESVTITTVLCSNWINSPQKAVQAAIFAGKEKVVDENEFIRNDTDGFRSLERFRDAPETFRQKIK